MLIFQKTKWIGLAIGLVSIATGCTQVEPEPSTGQLRLVANGEAFTHEGLVTKDGWELEFERVMLNLDSVVAFQGNALESAESDVPPPEVVLVDEPMVVDLTEGEAGAVTVVTQDPVPAGSYTAIAWQLVSQPDTPAIQLIGVARKDETTLNFQLQFDRPFVYECGEYVGDQRKGLVKPDEMGELEITTHWDHLFGDGTAAPDDEINTGALGFSPIATFANEGTVAISYSELMQQLSPEDAEILTKTLDGMGHVGEGHCESPEVS